MAMVFDRLRAALAPEYEVEREIATGGMGMVFLGRDIALDCPVAIKVLRPDLATAQAAERFLREARTLASVRHPHIVPVHRVGQAGEFFYYVMDFLDGETLADRLGRSPLRASEAVKLGRDLLDALQVVHDRLVVHRDIKPSNVFFTGDRAVLVDFGIAKPGSSGRSGQTTPGARPPAPARSLTAPGAVMGTLDYMPPEQLAGAEATPRTDLYAVGMVLYEALTGRKWSILDHPARADWSGVPYGIARVLRRALEWALEDRWPDAASFRRALWRTRTRPYVQRTMGLTVGGAAVGAAIVILWPLLRKPSGASLSVEIDRFAVSDGDGLSWLGDSIACALARSLNRYPDVWARGPCNRPWMALGRRVEIGGVVEAGADSLRVTARARGRRLLPVVRRGSPAGWKLLADSAADELFAELFGGSPLDSTPLAGVRPTTHNGTAAFLRAEQLFAQARWGEAYVAYGEAAAADTACWLCYWRHVEVGRWLGLPHDRSDSEPYLRHLGAFPPLYQSLIRADTLPLAARLDTLESVAQRSPAFLFGQFRFADELAHRGPLVGHARREALTAFQQVLRLRSNFGPAWEHVAWIHIAEGDSGPADEALARYRAMGASRDLYTAQVRTLLQLAFAWRFLPEQRARALTRASLREAEAAGVTNLDAGARYLSYFGDPRGAIELGRLLEARPSLQRSALIAATLGYLGLGRSDSARLKLRALGDRYAEPGLGLFATELEAVLLFLDDDSSAAAARWPAVRGLLDGYASLHAAPPELRRRAVWLERVVASRFEAGRTHAPLVAEAPPQPFTVFLHALHLASSGDYRAALDASEPLTVLEPGRGQVPDPFFLTVLHLARARWYQAQGGATENAWRELLWHEHSDLFTYPTGDPQAAEVDWALGPLAQWTAARLLDASGGGEDACRAYRTVARSWASAEPPSAVRADSARRRLAGLHCGASR